MKPDPSPVTNLIDAFRASKAMFTAASLGVFDKLEEQPMTADEIAAALDVSADALERLLDATVALGLLAKSGGSYRNEPVSSAFLTRNSPDSLIGYVLYSDQALFPLWTHLDDAVREGTNRWQQSFGTPGPLFDHFFRTPERMHDFIRGMHGFGLLSSPQVVLAFDLGEFRRVVDLGGATGHLVISACERYADLQGVVFDLPKVTAAARENVERSAACERLEVIAGDFFEDKLPSGDLYMLGRILHDWTEAKIDRLLKRIFAALPPGGAVLIAERLLDDDKTGPLNAALQSLNMLCCTEGKERNFAEYRAILERAGFQQVEARRTGVFLDAILARKPA